MSSPEQPRAERIKAFGFEPGRVLAGRYEVLARIGGGWEGEVYKVREVRTGVVRAAKLFFPHRNVRDRAVRLYAKKLDALKHSSIVTQYHHSETVRYRRQAVSCLLSEFVEGELLHDFIARQPYARLPVCEALHIVYELTKGIEEIHHARLYHGDLHSENVLVRRIGIGFRLKLVDFFHYGPTTAARLRDDIVDIAHLLFESLGGREHYAQQPAEIKAICKGLRRDLITRTFPTARHLRKHLETFPWRGDPGWNPRPRPR